MLRVSTGSAKWRSHAACQAECAGQRYRHPLFCARSVVQDLELDAGQAPDFLVAPEAAGSVDL